LVADAALTTGAAGSSRLTKRVHLLSDVHGHGGTFKLKDVENRLKHGLNPALFARAGANETKQNK